MMRLRARYELEVSEGSAADPSTIASLRNVSRIVNSATILKDVSMQFKRGEMTIITGESGAGKSTVGRVLEAIEAPDAGQVELFGQDLARLSRTKLNRLLSQRVGIGFQTPNLDTNLLVSDNLFELSEATGREVDLNYAAQTIVRLGLTASLNKKASTLSGGEKQRVSLARLLMTKPELLILDEPTAALDPVNRLAFLTHVAVSCASEGMSAIVVSHDEVARTVAHREFAMSAGRLVSEQVLRPPVLTS